MPQWAGGLPWGAARRTMSTTTRLDAVADRLGRPQLWGSVVVHIVGFVVAIAGGGLLIAASAAPAIGVASAAVNTVGRDLLRFEPLPDSIGERPERSVVLARNGRVLAVLHDVENRKLVPLDEVPKRVQDAVIATEDADFWDHRGVNWRAIARAYVGNYQAGEITSGASTITQQLVKHVVTKDTSLTYQRKLREAHFATELERRLTKAEILQEYLNLAYFGHGVYGIGTAAEYYFDKPVGDLTVVQAALLAGMIRAPEINDPIDRPEDARGRRNIVLSQMAEHGYLTPVRAEKLQRAGLRLRLAKAAPKGESFFVTYVTELLKQHPALGPTRQARAEALLRGGLTIRTTVHPPLERQARKAIASVLPDVDGPQAALTAVDPRTGEILAMGVGPKRFGKDKNESQVTPAVRGLGSPSGRQPGSAFKVFQLVTALENGITTAYTFNAKSEYKFRQTECNPPDYTPGNYADASLGVLDMQQALSKSSNTYFAHLEDKTGPRRLVETAHRMGITSDLAPFCSTVLGTSEVYGLDMASAYGTLANRGSHCEPYAITEVIDRHGRALLRNSPTCTQAVARGVADTATHLLRGPIEAGTATTNGQIGRPAAGKTGTTDNYGNAWFVGFVPQLSVSSWVGHPARTKTLYDGRCPGGRVTGGCLPTMIWSRFMRAAVEKLDLPPRGFPTPPPLPKAEVPDVLGRTLSVATRSLRRAEFQVQAREVRSHRPAGTVLRQRPRAGSIIEVGSAVVLRVSDGQGPPPMPDLIGMTEQQASNALGALGLVGRSIEVGVKRPDNYGRVVSQTPRPGTPLDQVGDIVVGFGAPRPKAPEEPEPEPQPADKPGSGTKDKSKGKKP
ncbi:MAG: PASTA domain-containing protein [Nitriliruptorales bacterium]|nr:PASTA domain-containing protein [Nitriliruptorales bacterium]